MDKRQWQLLYSSEMTLLPEVKHLHSFNIISPHVYHLLPNLWKASYTISASTSVDLQQWQPNSTNNRLSCVLMYPSQWFFHFGEKIIITWTHIQWVWRLLPVSPITSGEGDPWQRWQYEPLHCHEGWRDSLPTSAVTFSWVLDEDDYGGNCSSRQRLLSVFEGLVWCSYHSINVICHNEHRLHITLCRAHFLWTTGARMLPFIWLSLQLWFLWASPSFVQSDDPSKEVITFPLVPVQQVLCICIPLPLLHLGQCMGYPMCCNFAVAKNVMQNVEHGFVAYTYLSS